MGRNVTIKSVEKAMEVLRFQMRGFYCKTKTTSSREPHEVHQTGILYTKGIKKECVPAETKRNKHSKQLETNLYPGC